MNVENFGALKKLSARLGEKLYLVGGVVRNYLLCGKFLGDIDLASANAAEELEEALCAEGLQIDAVYKRTGTVMFRLPDGEHCEHTTFRREEYEEGGAHTPARTAFTGEIAEDARRRDFKCNAIYMDVVSREIADPLGGEADVRARRLDTTVSPREVFRADGLRLLRLCRFAAELGFAPTEETVAGAREFRKNIDDISAERIWDELKKMLLADRKYPFSDPRGHYTALKLCHKIGVLERIMPELTAGDGMPQRSDFHDHDVLEHSLRTVLYADPRVRLAALLHDVGKPYAMRHFGAYKTHNENGEVIARDILMRLKAPKAVTEEVCALTYLHMTDLDGRMKEGKVRLFLAEHFALIEKLLLLKQADYSACKDDLSPAPTVEKWKKIMAKMEAEGAPLSLSQLKIGGKELAALGYRGKEIGEELSRLFRLAVLDGKLNDPAKLKELAARNLPSGGK